MSKKQTQKCAFPTTGDRIIRLPEVINRTGYTKPSIYRLMKENQFPQCVKLGPRAIGWHESIINAWVDSRKQAV